MITPDRFVQSTMQRIFDGIVPAAAVLEWQTTLCEDGRTLLVLVELADGNTAAISVCPGESIAVSLV